MLVGVDTTSLYPTAARTLPQVGYMRALSAEGVLGLKPSLIMATTEAEKTRVIDALKAGVNNYIIKPFTPDAFLDKVKQTLAKAGGAAAAAPQAAAA